MNKNKNELTITKGKLCFISNDMKNFSAASHDISPLHMDSAYAGQTEYGDCILFGFLGSLAGLGNVRFNSSKHLKKLEIEFRNPLFINKDYSISTSTANKKINIDIADEGKTLIAIKAIFDGKKQNQLNEQIISNCKTEGFLKDIQTESIDYSEEEFTEGIVKSGYYETDKVYVEKLKKEFFPTDSIVRPIHIESLMLCSYIAGMILPGRRSLCVSLDISFFEATEQDMKQLEYKAESVFYNKDFNLLGINIKIYHRGSLMAEGELHVRVREDNFEYKTADKIVISSTFTDTPLLTSLKYWGNALELSLDFEFAPYNQVFQELLNPNSCTAKNSKGMNVLLIRFGDWLRFKEGDRSHKEEVINYLNMTLNQLIHALRTFSKRSNSNTLLLICPTSEDSSNPYLTDEIFNELNNKLIAELKDVKNIDILESSSFNDQYEAFDIYDPMRDQLGHVPFTEDYYHLLGTLIIRRYYQMISGTYKVIVLDCDNTLWKGICGEAGPLGITVNDGYKMFQEFLLEQSEKGMLLCLCSKNVESDVWQVFEKNTMPLKREHITEYKINWEAKSKNIKEMAESLNLGMDSFIFIDDNPLECAEVRMNCPQVLTLQWPKDPGEQLKMLNHIWVLDHYSVTEEDKMRTQMYQVNRSRVKLQEASDNYYSFLQDLNLNIVMNKVTKTNLPRVAQLTQRTNQFNFTTIRRNQKEVETLLTDKNYECITVDVEDRFGSYGLVGVMITKQLPKVLVIDTFLLSCRVLGRGVEYEMIKKLGEIAKNKGLDYVKLLFNKTSKNKPAEQFLDQIALQYKGNEESDDNFSYLIPVEKIEHIEMHIEQDTQIVKEKDQFGNESKPEVSFTDIREREVKLEHIYKTAGSLLGINKEINEFLISASNKQEIHRRNDIEKNNDTIFNKILNEIRQLFATHLEIPFEEVDPNEELEQFHIDSYKIMDIMVRLGNEYDGLPATLLFEHRNLTSIVHYLMTHYKDQLERKYPSFIGKKENDKLSDEKTESNYCEIHGDGECTEDIAIIGINGLYPGAQNMSELWELLANGRTSISKVPQERWNNEDLFDPLGNATDKTYSNWGAFIKDIDRFEATFFNIAPREAELMDPQQRLFLQVVWGLLEDAGYTSESMDRNTGVFAAVVAADYGTLSDQAALNGISAYRDSDFYQIPNRISYFFNFNGPSMAINTACSGSGTAVHLAYESLKRGECNTAIVGGINLFIHPSRWIQYAQIHFHSPDGVCRPFGAGANGTVFGEGVGAILLKRLSDAVRDKDHIYGVIKATAINSGGKTNGFTVPNPRAQADIVSQALKQAKIDPRTVSYIEAHGTGTALGDPIEIRGLTMAFEENFKDHDLRMEIPYCAVGSIKANIGHSESGAALSGIIKILLQMKYGMLVPSLNAEKLNEKIPFDKTPFYVQQKLEEWKTPVYIEEGIEKHYPKRAGISSFGAGGSNSHILLEAYENLSLTYSAPYQQQVIILSSKNKGKLMRFAKNLLQYLEENKLSSYEIKDGNDEVTLAQIAYTLQMGRTAFEERVAFVVSDIDELIQLIHYYIEGKTFQNKIYTGNIKSDHKLLKSLYDGLTVDTIIESIIDEGKLYKLAQLWTIGIEVDWKYLHQNQNPGRVSLPGYPFDGEKLWIPVCENKNNVEKVMVTSSKLHPMIDSNTSTLDQQRFSSVYTGEEFFLAEHIIAGNKVFPGVGYLEVARAAAEYSGIHKLYKIIDVVWSKPIIVEYPSEIQICLYPTERDIEYEITAITANGECQLHGQGRLVPSIEDGTCEENVYKTDSRTLNIDAIKQNCKKHIEHEAFYKRYSETGCEYGRNFKAVREVFVGNHEALAFLQFPSEGNIRLNEMQLHPSLMDGALQTVIAFVDEDDNSTYLPFALGELELISTLNEKCYAYALLTTETNSYRKYDITITDVDGKVLAKIKDYSLRALQKTVDSTTLKDNATLYFRPNWKPSPLSSNDDFAKIDNIVIFGDDEALIHKLKNDKQIKFDTVISVKEGQGFAEISEYEYSINPSDREHYDELFRVLREKNKMPTIILHLWSIGLEKEPMISVYSVYHLCRAIIIQKLSQQIRLIYTYQNSETATPFYKALGSMLKTVGFEASKISYKTIGLESTIDLSLPSVLLDELLSDGSEVEYKDGQRFVKEMIEVTDLRDADKTSVILKEKGVYLITGGVGGLGLVFAKYLAKTYHSRIILVGRSKLDSLKEDKLDALKQCGAEVTYIQADISKKEDVENLFAQIKSNYHKINGIIHSAGVIKDSYLINKSVNEIQDVLAPKVYGTIWLDEVTQNEPLDFFVMFSSISAILGNPGQTDYAYANSFMDYFAVKRDSQQKQNKRFGKTISINWPLWQDGGMKADDETVRLLENTLGLRPFETKKGIETFELGLKQEAAQLMVVQGNANKLRKSILKNRSEEESKIQSMVQETSTADNEVVYSKLQKDLKYIVSDILKLNINDIDLEEDMSSFGFDSISFTGFSNRLNEQFNLHVMPSLFYEHPTLLSLVNHLIKEHKTLFYKYYGESVQTTLTQVKAIKEETVIKTVSGRERNRFRYSTHQGNQAVKEDSGSNEPIAIIGMSGVMPQSDTLEEFWNHLKDEKDLITEIPKDRWDWEKIYGDAKYEANKTKIKWGGFLKEVDKFDPLFFGISPREAELMDPQQRIFLEVVWKTIEDAGYRSMDISGTNTGVFVGVATTDYSNVLKENAVDIQAQTSTGSAHSVLANRVSYLLNIHGPSEPIDTACSSSLTAVHRAVEAIRLGHCKMAIAGGVNILVSSENYIAFNKAGMLSDDGKCKTFDKSANGYVRGEGSGALLLKPLSKAIEDGNHIYGVIKGSDVNHGGHVSSLTTPNPNAQAEVIYKAWKNAGVDPTTIDYIEAHGTGTSLGDPIEINGLKKAFNRLYKDWDIQAKNIKHCGIGSVKTNIGHLETAAGIAGVIKVLLSFKNNHMPASIHLNEMNPYIQLDSSPLYIVNRTRSWKRIEGRPRRAGISSFGFGGTNAHVAIEEYLAPETTLGEVNEPQMIVLSAKNRDRLRDYVKTLVQFIDSGGKADTYSINKKLLPLIEKEILQLTADLINVPEDEISFSDPLEEYGFDPITISQLFSAIKELYRLEKLLNFGGYISIKDMAQYILEHCREAIYSYYSQAVYEEPLTVKQNIRLSDMAYTLQLGRDAMPERLAVIVSDLNMLRDLLTDYLSNKTNIENLFERSTNSRQKVFDFIEGEEGHAFINSLIKNKKLVNIAKYWVAGGDVNWELFYDSKKQKYISLPTYPFARERYWIPERTVTQANEISPGTFSRLHPLIERNISTLEEQRFTTIFNGNEFFLKDHVIVGNKTLPGVAYIEMARAAGVLSGIEVKNIKDIIWIRPIIIQESTKEVSIHLYPEKSYIEYEVTTLGDMGDTLIHGQGKLMIEEDYALNSIQKCLDITSIKQRCNRLIDKEEYYRRYLELGYEYGNTFMPIDSLFAGREEVLARLIFPQDADLSLSDMILHPSLMDGAFQAAAAVDEEADAATYLPFSLGRVEIIKSIKESCYAYVKLISRTTNIKKYDIDIVDEQGELLIRFTDLSLRSLNMNDQAAAVIENDTLYYSSEWEKAPLINEEANKTLDNLLIFCADKGQYKTITENATFIHYGTAFTENNDDEFEINPDRYEDYYRLFSVLKHKNNLPTHILHLWSMDNETRNDFNVQDLDQALKISAYSLYHLSRALLNLRIKHQVNIIYGYLSEAGPHYEAVGSMLKTVALEASFIKYKTIGFNTKDNDIINSLLTEFKSDDLEVMYKDNKRFTKVIKPNDLVLKNIDKQSLIKEKGVYIITGGVGGLGLIFANHLAKQYHGRLILTGRSALNEAIQNQINQLKEYGAQITYIQADISRKEDVDSLIDKVKATYSGINGIIHSAGVIKDAYLINKTEEEMNAVLAAKVFGTTWLDEATKDENLDFFVMFSSITSVLGNAGQADYAYGNGHMDCYAHYRERMRRQNKRRGKSLSINWPLWRDGGMKIDHQTEKLLEKTLGLTLFDTESGIETFELSLRDTVSQLMVLQGNSRRINCVINKEQEVDHNVVNHEADNEIVVADVSIHKALQEDLKQVISSILKIKTSDIDLEEEMSSFGFDSISFTEFSNALNDQYHTDVMPSVFYEHSNLISLVDFLMRTYKNKLDHYYRKTHVTINNTKNITNFEKITHIADSDMSVSKRRPRFNQFSISKASPSNQATEIPVAIIGLSCVMPGSENYQEFWNNILNGKDLITEVPDNRWDWKAYEGNPNIKWGGFVNDIDKFDPLFFGISPKEAALMDPQHRMMLENVWHSIEDAGYKAFNLSGTRTGVFIGAGACDYSYLLKENQVDLQAQISTGTAFSIMANRISYQLDLRGPSEVIDTACSSSLVALHRAVESIQKDGCELAFAAGINVLLNPETFILLSQAGMLSTDGRCKTFDKRANGYVRGEGCGVLLLKPLAKAIEDKDSIYAVIKGSAINHGGHVNTLTTPNPNAQADLIVSAWKDSGIDPATIGYIEAHGTGTSLGDPIEINGLKKAFERLSKDRNKTVTEMPYCGIGSVKTNIGHLEFGAGIAGVIKVLLAMKNKMLPPSINFEEINPYIQLDSSSFYIVDQAKEWATFRDSNHQILPRRAGVSSFGFGGVNAHVALEEYIMPGAEIEVQVTEPQIIVLSARNEERLKIYAKHLLDYVDQQLYQMSEDSTALVHVADIAYTLQAGREAMEERLAFVVNDLRDLKEKLTLYCKGEEVKDLSAGNVKNSKDKINLILVGEKGRHYLRSILEDKEYSRIARLWVCGVEIDWTGIYETDKRKRIALPTYPFARESYWIQDAIGDKTLSYQKIDKKAEIKGIHPLVDKNTSDFYGQKFTTRLNENAFYLAHHIVEGSKTLPGAAVIEMAYTTGILSSHRVISKIKDIIWAKPIIVDNGFKDVHICLTTDGDRIEYTLHEVNSDESTNECAQGALIINNEDIPVSDSYVDIGMIGERCSIHMNEEQCYQWFSNMGLEYGVSFRTIKEIHCADNEALSLIRLPDHLNHEFDTFMLHPALLDGALQSIIGLQYLDSEVNTLALPISIKAIEILHPLERNCYVYVKESRDKMVETLIKKYDLEIINKQGMVLVRINEFMVKPLRGSLSGVRKQETPRPSQKMITMDAEESILKQARQRLRKILSEEINLPESKIDLYEPFEKYGINSIMIMSLNRVLESHFGSLSKTLFFEYKNLYELAGYFAENYRERFIRENEKESNNAYSLVNGENEVAAELEEDKNRTVVNNRFISDVHLLNNSQSLVEADIAIIGVSGRYPMANTLEAYWENLKAGKDCITEIPKDRWDYSDFYDPDKNKKGKSYSKWGGFIEGVDEFDPMFFKITPKEAEYMDPQERLFLQTVWHTIEDAGYTKLKLEKEKIGVFAGVMYNQYPMFAAEEAMKGNMVAVNATNASIANRVSYYLNLSGPSMALDTMCSSSLTAIHLACESIKRGECDAALAGGVNITIHPNKYIMLSQGRFASSDGRCRSFGEGGDGYVPGEGVGAVLLKPLKKAVKDGDRIYCVIKGTTVNHGGKTNGYSVPNPNAQSDLIAEALKKAEIHPRTISYLEAHGTGTSLGDPIEITGLQKAFANYTKDTGFCSIGSSKSNIGHLESAAGIAAITKVILQMKYKTLVPSIHSDHINPNIDFESTPFYVQHELKEWKSPLIEGKVYPLRAGISSFGAGGANAHIILEEFKDTSQNNNDNLKELQLILLSAKDEERLRAYALSLLDYIEKHQSEDIDALHSIAYTLQTGREAMEERLALIVSDFDELKLRLSQFLKDQEAEHMYTGIIKGRINEEDFFDENKQNQFKALFDSKSYEEIAKRWIMGEGVDWTRLYQDSNNRVISLPVYPFAKEQYWIASQDTITHHVTLKPQNALLLHPLVGKNISTLNEQCFVSVFTGEEFYLADHVVEGKKMMPAAALVEMARAAGDFSDTDKVIRLKDIMWLKPLTVEDNDKECHIKLFPYDRFVEYEIGDMTVIGTTNIYSKGKLFYTHLESNEEVLNEKVQGYPAGLENAFTGEIFRPEAIREICSHKINREECYQTFDKLGIHYGNSFKVIQELYIGKQQAFAKLELPISVESSEFAVHPVLLDGLFQTVLGVGYNDVSTQLNVPFSIGEITINGSMSHKGYSYAMAKNNTLLRKDTKIYDIYFLDESGNVQLMITDFTVKAFSNYTNQVLKSHEELEITELLNKVYLGEAEAGQVIEIIGSKEGV